MTTAGATTENVESLTLRQCFGDLSTAVSTDLSAVAESCYACKLITIEQYDEAQLEVKTKRVRARVLVQGVIDNVSLDPQKFWPFVAILEESGMFVSVVRDVQNMYAENQSVRKVVFRFTQFTPFLLAKSITVPPLLSRLLF